MRDGDCSVGCWCNGCCKHNRMQYEDGRQSCAQKCLGPGYSMAVCNKEVQFLLQNAGIEICAVGIQRADMNSQRAMASPALEEHVFLVESFGQIQQSPCCEAKGFTCRSLVGLG